MFSWNSTGRGGGRMPATTTATATPATSTYPGMRHGATVAGTAAVAQPIQGSIRPPPSSSATTILTGGASSYSRQEHLESYLKDETLQRSTRRISSDDSTYDTVFQTVSGDTLILRVHLPPPSTTASLSSQQPVKPPVLTLAGIRARHEWLDYRMRINPDVYTAISPDQWKRSPVLLGKVVHQVVQHLQLHPPDLMEITDDGLRKIQQPKNNIHTSTSTTATTSNTSSTMPQQQQQQPYKTQHYSSATTDAPPDYETLLSSSTGAALVEMPVIPTQFEELNDLDREALEELLTDELAFLQFVHSRVPTQQALLKLSTSTLVKDNAEKAKEHLEKHQEPLNSLHENVATLLQDLKVAVANFQTLEQEQDQWAAPPDEETVRSELTAAKRRAFETSEHIAEEWLESSQCSQQISTFCTKFLKERTEHHVYAAKLELLERQ